MLVDGLAVYTNIKINIAKVMGLVSVIDLLAHIELRTIDLHVYTYGTRPWPYY